MRRCAECFKEIPDKKAKCSHCGFDNSKIKIVPGAIKPGRMIDDRYYIGSVLGQGGFGITYKGLDVDLDRIIAIKEYYPKNSVNRSEDGFNVKASDSNQFKKGLNYFTEEAKSLAKFQGHPNIVSVQNYFRSNNTAYMVMEFMEGRTVREILRGGKTLPTTDSIKIILGVLDGLAACHKQNLIHRDLTPDNVYITRNSQIKILDFGSARQTKEGEDNEFTQILKESYAPIEQYQKSGAQGAYTDIYSVVATFYRLLTGKPPPHNATDRIIEDKLKRPSQVINGLDISVSVEDVLMKAMAVRPNDRYQTVDQFKKDLINAINDPNAVKAKPGTVSSKNKSSNLQPRPLKDKPKEKAPKVQEALKAKPKKKEEKQEPKPKQAVRPEESKVASKENVELKQPQVADSEKKSFPVAGIVGIAAALVLFVGYQILNPSMQNPLDEATIAELNQGQNQSKTLSPDASVTERENINEGRDKLVNLDNYQLKVNVFPDNVNAVVKVLETKDPYTYGQILPEGEYTLQMWAPGYRTKILRNTKLNRNRTIDVDLERLRTPSINVMNAFYSLVANPSESAYKSFSSDHRSSSQLAQIYDVYSDNKNVVKELSRLAKGGDAESNFILGVGEIQGFLTQNDNKIQNAKFYLETAYSQGYKPASLWLALSNSCSFTNDSPGCDERQAEALLNENSYDIPLADFLLAKLYLDQNKSLSASLRLAEKASASGVTHASYLMGDIAFRRNDLNQSKRYWKRAADEGSTDAMIRLASLEENQESGESIKWLTKAYQEGNKKAGTFLAIEQAKDNPSNFYNTAKNLEKQKISDGQFLSGWAYFNGVGTKVNLQSSFKSFSSCSDLNCKVMTKILNLKLSSSANSVKNYVADLEKFNNKRNLEKLLPDVKGEMFFQLGKTYLNNKDNQSKRKGMGFLEESIKFGNLNSLEFLCRAAGRGKGIPRDVGLALSYCIEASDAGSVNSLTYNMIGELLENDTGRSTSFSSLVSVYSKSCSLKDGSGCCSLAKTYHREGMFEARNKNIQLAEKYNFGHCKLIIGVD